MKYRVDGIGTRVGLRLERNPTGILAIDKDKQQGIVLLSTLSYILAALSNRTQD